MSSLTFLSGTITPWLLGALFLLSLMALVISIKAWRDMKRSPYFFQRRQAAKQLQTYMTASMALFLLGLGVAAFAWQAPVDTTPRVAILTNAKPPKEEIQKLVRDAAIAQAKADAQANAETAEISTASRIAIETQPAANVAGVAEELFTLDLKLPEAYNRFEPTAELNSNTDMGTLSFSREIGADYKAIDAGLIFPQGSYTLYATFDYEGMADGMAWAWVWRYNGRVIEGGNEVWAYGDSGPGYIYFGPEEGFQPGQYSLEVWVNEELMTIATVVVNDAAVTAGN